MTNSSSQICAGCTDMVDFLLRTLSRCGSRGEAHLDCMPQISSSKADSGGGISADYGIRIRNSCKARL